MTHALKISEADSADQAGSISSALGVIEQLLAQLGPEANSDDIALALWEPVRALGEAASEG